VTLGDVGPARGASWSRQGTIIFALGAYGVIHQVSDAGGTGQPVTRFEKGENSHRWPEFLPDGKAMLFVGGPSVGNWTTAQVVAQSSTGERRKLIDGGTYPRYAISGHLLYVQAGTIMAVPFDAKRSELNGKAFPVVENVIQSPITGAAQYSFSDTGALAYVGGGVQAGQQKLVWVSRNGAEQPLTTPPHAYAGLRLSPDGQRVVVEISEKENQLWLYDFARDILTRLTFGGDTNGRPVWTPDGKRIAFRSNREGTLNIFWQLADGGGGLERMTSDDYPQTAGSFSPDGQLLAFTELNPTTGYDIWVLRLSDRKAQPFLRTASNETTPQFSPDGHWLAYASDESGRPEVYVQPYPGPGGKWQISTEGGDQPAWNRNGRELFYHSNDKMMVVGITMQPSFSVGKPKMLFAGEYVLPGFPSSYENYDISPDGQRFLMVKDSEQAAEVTQINVVLNWFEELKQKVPTGKK